MKTLSKFLTFNWDKGNLDKNWKKHRVSNKEAEQAFLNKPKYIFKDEKHSKKEKRYGLFGRTNKHRFLSLVFTLRSNKIRIITARDMSKKERKAYEKFEKSS